MPTGSLLWFSSCTNGSFLTSSTRITQLVAAASVVSAGASMYLSSSPAPMAAILFFSIHSARVSCCPRRDLSDAGACSNSRLKVCSIRSIVHCRSAKCQRSAESPKASATAR